LYLEETFGNEALTVTVEPGRTFPLYQRYQWPHRLRLTSS
jgi:hypothetical protein